MQEPSEKRPQNDDEQKTREAAALTRLMAAGVGLGEPGRWSNLALADKVGVAEGTVSNWKNAKTVVQPKHRKGLLAALFPNAASKRGYEFEFDVLSGMSPSSEISNISEPVYSKRDVWNLLLRPIQDNVERLVVEGGVASAGGLELSDISSTPIARSFHLPQPTWFRDWASEPNDAGRLPYDLYDPIDLEGSRSLSHFWGLDRSGRLKESVERHAEAYARFVKQKHSDPNDPFPPYNKPKVGLLGWSQPVPADREERAHLTLRCYETDYFTHRVMRDVTKDMRAHFPHWFEDLRRYPENDGVFLPYFTTSVGLNIITVTRDNGVRRFQLSAMSKEVGNLNQQGKWHVSANEGLNMDDVYAGTRQISFEGWLRRSLNEELGVLLDADPDPIAEVVFPEFSFEITNFEPFLSCLVHLNMTSDELVRGMKSNARDGRREITQVRSHPFAASAAINALLEQDAGIAQFSTYALLILDLFIERGLFPLESQSD